MEEVKKRVNIKLSRYMEEIEKDLTYLNDCDNVQNM